MRYLHSNKLAVTALSAILMAAASLTLGRTGLCYGLRNELCQYGGPFTMACNVKQCGDSSDYYESAYVKAAIRVEIGNTSIYKKDNDVLCSRVYTCEDTDEICIAEGGFEKFTKRLGALADSYEIKEIGLNTNLCPSGDGGHIGIDPDPHQLK